MTVRQTCRDGVVAWKRLRYECTVDVVGPGTLGSEVVEVWSVSLLDIVPAEAVHGNEQHLSAATGSFGIPDRPLKAADEHAA